MHVIRVWGGAISAHTLTSLKGYLPYVGQFLACFEDIGVIFMVYQDGETIRGGLRTIGGRSHVIRAFGRAT